MSKENVALLAVFLGVQWLENNMLRKRALKHEQGVRFVSQIRGVTTGCIVAAHQRCGVAGGRFDTLDVGGLQSVISDAELQTSGRARRQSVDRPPGRTTAQANQLC